jgi:anti-sigma regulatory factor (Ser/Thr protein kinase)
MRDPLRHEAAPYSGHEQFVSLTVSMLRDALDRDERSIFLDSQAKLDDVREALGPDADDVTLVATDEHGRNPARITTMLDSFRHGGDGRRALGVTENVAAGRRPAALVEAQLAESVLNSPSLQAWRMSVVCLYDATALDAAALHEMRRSHPIVRGEDDDNDDYDARLLDELFTAPLPAAPAEAETLKIVGPRLMEMRDFVRRCATQSGIAPDRVDDLVLAANEIGTNSLRHAAGRFTVRVWSDGDSAVCEMQDNGIIRDPLIGRFAPSPDAASGRGLWLANHLCDLVQIRSVPPGTVVRLFVDR